MMNNTTWIIPNNETGMPPSSNMSMSMSMTSMTNQTHAAAVSMSSKYFNNNNSPGMTIILFIIFAFLYVVVMFWLMSRLNVQQQQQQQQQRQDERDHEGIMVRQNESKAIDFAKTQQQFRTKLIQQMTKEQLIMTLTSLNFRTVNDSNTGSTVLDMEQGDGVPIVGETTAGDETLPEKSDEVGGSVEGYNVKQKAHDGLRLSNEENNQVPDLEDGTCNRTDRAETGSKTISIKNVENTTLQKKRMSIRFSTGSSLHSEVFVMRAEHVLSIRNECAICLDGYNPGDVITWSNNGSCKHVFHQECILNYLVQKKKQEAPCPCCRQVFFKRIKILQCTRNDQMDEQLRAGQSNDNTIATTRGQKTTIC